VALEAAGAEAAVAAQAGYDRVVGVRAMLSWHADPAKRFAARADLMQDAALAGVRTVGRHGLHLEAMIYPGQADEFARAAAAFPDQIFIVNHCASPVDRDAASIERWRAALRQLAGEPNVMLKISNVGAYVSAPTRAEVREVALRCIDAFRRREMHVRQRLPSGAAAHLVRRNLRGIPSRGAELRARGAGGVVPRQRRALLPYWRKRRSRLEGRRATAKPAGIE
jgi:hypothetical protein